MTAIPEGPEAFDRVTATRRPMASDEVAYLERYAEATAATRQATLINGGLVALPIGFVWGSITSGSGGLENRVALVLAGLILSGLVAAILAYGRAPRVVFPPAKDLWRLRGLGDDLAGREARIVKGAITAKDVKGGRQRKSDDRPSPRHYMVTVAGTRYELAGPTWLSLAVGQEVQLVCAPRSRVVLAVDDRKDRLGVPSGGPHPEDEPPGGRPFTGG